MNPRERLERFQNGVGKLSEAMPDTIGKLLGFISAAESEGVLTCREKELVALGASFYNRCEECIVVHVYKALAAGCTRPEILEACSVAMIFGGGPTLGASATLVLESLDEFEPDFAK